MIYKYNEFKPNINEDCFIADNSTIIGNVNIDQHSSIWFGAVVRGDTEKIYIGENTNVQDNCTLHAEEKFPVKIGNGITIGHNCIIHGCRIDNNCLIGINSVILNGVEIGENCIIGAGSLITQNVKIPSGVLCFGSPAKVIRKLSQEEIDSIKENAVHYVKLSEVYRNSI